MKRVVFGVAMLLIGVALGASLNAWPGSAAPEISPIVGTWHYNDPMSSERGIFQFSSDGTAIATFAGDEATYLGAWADNGDGWFAVTVDMHFPDGTGQGLMYWIPNTIVGDEIWYGDQLIMSRVTAELSDTPGEAPPAASPYGMP
jgi:hypothetical protein